MSADVNTVKVNILDKDYQVSCPAAERLSLIHISEPTRPY